MGPAGGGAAPDRLTPRDCRASPGNNRRRTGFCTRRTEQSGGGPIPQDSATRAAAGTDTPRDTVIITGSSGFLGQAIAARLIDRYRVVGLDLAAPKRAVESMRTVEVDLTSEDSVASAVAETAGIAEGRIASVIHLAAYYDLTGENDPKYQAVTVEGTRRLLRALRPHGIGQFVFASTLLVHAPTEPGRPIDEDAPLEPKWAYPKSKVETEALLRAEHGDIPLTILRLAGVYDENCRAAFIAQQIARIYERQPMSHLFAGDISRGQPNLHVADLLDAIDRVVERRAALPQETTLLLGEDRTPSYETLQKRIGALIHGEEWSTLALPKALAKAGAWLQDDVLDQNAFIKPWMIDISDDHYELDLSRAHDLLGWAPRHDFLDTLPEMIARLKADPPGWYALNKLNPAVVAAATPEVEAAEARARREAETEAAAVERGLAEAHRRSVWTQLTNIALGLWLVVGPFAYGLFDGAGGATPPPAAGHELAAATLRDAWLGWSEIASGIAIAALSTLALARRHAWLRWLVALVGVWILFAPLVFWTTSAAAYATDTLIGMLVIVFAVVVPGQPGIAREALASKSDLPLGWSYSPSTYVQRVPIIGLAFVGLFVSRYLAAYQLGHIDSLWDPFFTAPAGAGNGSEAVVTSSISRAFPIADAGFGAVAYALDILTGAGGDRRRWRTMPWLVFAFGLLIIPLGLVSVGFIMMQPTLIGALCTLCLIQAAVTVILIPYSIDEVLASVQFLFRSRRAGRPFWRTLLRGGAALSEEVDPTPGIDAPLRRVAREFATGGVTYPWTLLVAVAIGIWLMATPALLGTAGPLYFSDHVVGCLVITVAVTALAEVARAVRLVNVALGAWVVASPFLLAGGTTASMIAAVVAGLALILVSLPRGARSAEHYGGWDRFIV